jgi:hypothetical protein
MALPFTDGCDPYDTSRWRTLSGNWEPQLRPVSFTTRAPHRGSLDRSERRGLYVRDTTAAAQAGAPVASRPPLWPPPGAVGGER